MKLLALIIGIILSFLAVCFFCVGYVCLADGREI